MLGREFRCIAVHGFVHLRRLCEHGVCGLQRASGKRATEGGKVGHSTEGKAGHSEEGTLLYLAFHAPSRSEEPRIENRPDS